MTRNKDYYNGKANGEKLLKRPLVKLIKRGGKTGITQLIYESLCKLGACTVTDLAQNIWESDETGIATQHFKDLQVFNRFVASTLYKLYAQGKITCLKFRTARGRVYGITVEDCWKYLFQNDLAPERLIKAFMSLLGSQGFVTNLELRELGFDTKSISKWIDTKLAKEGGYVRVHKFSTDLKIYFLPRYQGQLTNYLNSEQFMRIYDKYCLKRSFVHESGRVLELIVEELYKKMGYEYRKHFPIFDYNIREDKKSENEERQLLAILDGLAFKKIEDGNSPNDLIIVECKNCMKPITFQDIAHLIYIRQIRFKGRGEIHIIALNGVTKGVWNNIRFYPFVRIIDWKDFRDKCEKYLPETYVKLREEFGTLSRPVLRHFRSSSREVDLSEIKSYWISGDKL
jgi:hypothetical protein